MLAGVLLRFGTGLFAALPQRPLIVVAMLATFLLLQRLAFRAPTVGALAVGLLVAALTRDLHLGGLALEVARPRWVRPAFTVRAPPVDGAVLATGVASLLTAPFGGHGLNLAALMGAICAGPEAGPDPDRRYGAGVAAALWFLACGAGGATAATLFAGFPPALVAATAGLAMTPALVASLAGALAEPDERTGAVFALLLTAADIHLLGIGAPFCGLVLGALTSRLLRGAAR